MRYETSRSPLKIFILTLCLALSASALAQQPAQTKPAEPAADVIRVNTDLVQTDVTVVDKKGHAITSLKPEQFELRIDSRPQSLTFFEEVVAGSPEEEKQLNAARAGKSAAGVPTATSESNGGQLIFFFVDDVHLTGESWSRASSFFCNSSPQIRRSSAKPLAV